MLVDPRTEVPKTLPSFYQPGTGFEASIAHEDFFVQVGTSPDDVWTFYEGRSCWWIHGRRCPKLSPPSISQGQGSRRRSRMRIFLCKWGRLRTMCGPSMRDDHVGGSTDGGAQNSPLLLSARDRVRGVDRA